MGHILHDWGTDKKKLLCRNAYAALPSGGAFVVLETIIDDERAHHVPGLTMSLTMLVETGEGYDYSFKDFTEWCTEVGFKSFDKIPLTASETACVAYK